MNGASERVSSAWPEETWSSGAVRSFEAARDLLASSFGAYSSRAREPISARSHHRAAPRRPAHAFAASSSACRPRRRARRPSAAPMRCLRPRPFGLSAHALGHSRAQCRELAALVALVFRPRLGHARVRLRAVARPVPHLAAAVALVVRAGRFFSRGSRAARTGRSRRGGGRRVAAAADVDDAGAVARPVADATALVAPVAGAGAAAAARGGRRSRGATPPSRPPLSSRSSRIKMLRPLSWCR